MNLSLVERETILLYNQAEPFLCHCRRAGVLPGKQPHGAP